MPQTYRDAMRSLETALLTAELALHQGNITTTARALEMSLRTLHFRLRKLGVNRKSSSPDVPNE